MHRSIHGLAWVEIQREKPRCIPKDRPGPIQLEGIRYEGKVAKNLPEGFLHNPWFHFSDANGPGWASPDFLVPPGVWCARPVLVEVKLTDTPRAITQLSELYVPLAFNLYGILPKSIIVVKNIHAETKTSDLVPSISAALTTDWSFPLVHWRNKGVPLWKV